MSALVRLASAAALVAALAACREKPVVVEVKAPAPSPPRKFGPPRAEVDLVVKADPNAPIPPPVVMIKKTGLFLGGLQLCGPGELRADSAPIFAKLTEGLRPQRRHFERGAVVIEAEPEVAYEVVVKAMDAAKAAGFDEAQLSKPK